MLRQEFINRLSYALQALPQQERDKVIAYYLELIADKIEGGEAEADVIAEFGDINELAQSILIENNVYNQQPQPKKSSMNPVVIVLLVIFSPVIFGLFMALFGVAIGLTCAVFGVVFSFFVTSFALAIAGVMCFFTSFFVLAASPAYAFLQMGAGLLLAGISIFLFMGTYYLTKSVTKLFGLVINGIKNSFSKRRTA